MNDDKMLSAIYASLAGLGLLLLHEGGAWRLPHWLRVALVRNPLVRAFMRGYAEQRAKDEAKR